MQFIFEFSFCSSNRQCSINCRTMLIKCIYHEIIKFKQSIRVLKVLVFFSGIRTKMLIKQMRINDNECDRFVLECTWVILVVAYTAGCICNWILFDVTSFTWMSMHTIWSIGLDDTLSYQSIHRLLSEAWILQQNCLLLLLSLFSLSWIYWKWHHTTLSFASNSI